MRVKDLLVLVTVFLISSAIAGHSHSHSHGHSHSHDTSSTKTESNPNAWFHALLATLIISFAPILILPCVPISEQKGKGDLQNQNQSLLKILVSFAVGGLLGDVFLHLLPHAFSSPDSSSTEIGIWILIGMLVFFVLEKYIRNTGETESHGSHSHSHKIPKSDTETTPSTTPSTTTNNNHEEGSPKLKQRKKKNTKKNKEENPVESSSKIDPGGYLNLIADASHNFTDGMAIGSSFLLNYWLGVSTTIAVFFHEIPHEIGDYAILIQCGFTKRQAMFAQVMTGVGAIIGTFFGLGAQTLGEEASKWILPFTSGGFIYIATVGVIPTLISNTNLKQSIGEIVAMIIGVLIMYALIFFE